jgi:hypothetical protein
MSRDNGPEPRRIHFEGADYVLLTQEEYEKLTAQRRRSGAQANRNHALRVEIEHLTAHLAALEQAAAALPPCPGAPCGTCGPQCARDTLTALLAGHDQAGPG